LAEIQQTSDITYRIFDWNRVDAQGNGRELHTDLALEAIDYKAQTNYKTNFHSTLNQTKPVVVCPYFTTNIIPILGTLIKDYSANDSFVIYICTKGRVNLSYGNNQLEVIEMGESILLPNILNNITLKADLTSSLLEVLI
ncbi:MAG: mannose-6-phosphate isomerase, partial [Flavobacteriales bacterium CG03_land_8_20_14_0_80_35_15]